jgi:hypothetical protein
MSKMGATYVAFIDDGNVEAVSNEEVTATETACNDFDTRLDHVPDVAGKLGRDEFVDQAGNDADDDEEEEEGDERVWSFQLYEMDKIPRGTTGGYTRGDMPRDRLLGFRGCKKPLRNLVNGGVLPTVAK